MNIFDYNKLKEIGYDSIVFEGNDKLLDKISFIYQNLYKDDVYYLTDTCPIHEHVIEDLLLENILIYKQELYFPDQQQNDVYKFLFQLAFDNPNLIIIYLTANPTYQLIKHSSLYLINTNSQYNVIKDRYDSISDMDFSEVDMMIRNLKIDILSNE